MAVKIRLRRVGAKKAPFYRVVVADSRFPRDGRFIEEIGTYDPNQEPSVVSIDGEKAKAWIANGAQPTDTVRVLLKRSVSSLLPPRDVTSRIITAAMSTTRSKTPIMSFHSALSLSDALLPRLARSAPQ